MKRKIGILVAFLLINNVYCQYKVESTLIENRSYPKACVNNFIHWLSLSTSDWEKEMKAFSFSNRGIDEYGCVFYGSGKDLTDAVYSITKCTGNMMSSEWANFSNSTVTKLDDLLNELEPFYKKRDVNGNSEFAFKHEDYAYTFTLRRSNIGEFVVIVRTAL